MPTVTNSSYGLIFVKIRAKYGRIFSKNTSEIRAKIRAKFMFTTKNSKIKNEQNALFSKNMFSMKNKSKMSKMTQPGLDGAEAKEFISMQM